MEILFLHDYSRRPFQPVLPIATPSIYYNIYIYILYFSFFSISFYSIDAIAGGAKETTRENERESENRGDLWQPGPEKLIGVGALRAPVGT